MNREEIIEIMKCFLFEEFEVDLVEIILENNMYQIFGFDSFDYVDLVVVIEDNFGFKFMVNDFKQIVIFDEFFDFVVFCIV